MSEAEVGQKLVLVGAHGLMSGSDTESAEVDPIL